MHFVRNANVRAVDNDEVGGIVLRTIALSFSGSIAWHCQEKIPCLTMKEERSSSDYSTSFSLLSKLLLFLSCCHFAYRAWPTLSQKHRRISTINRNEANSSSTFTTAATSATSKPRILYIVTSLTEYDTGRRATNRGHNRFSHTLVPVVRESTRSMLDAGYDVDVYLIAHYTPSPEHAQALQAALPDEISLTVWPEATPYFYKDRDHSDPIRQGTLALHELGLSRQHRYAIKDLLLYYDMFVSFEDDMLIKGVQVQHYERMTQHLYRLRQAAPEVHTDITNRREALQRFYGPLTKRQYARIIPGLFRVEVALPGWHPHADNLYEKIPLDYTWNESLPQGELDPVCCVVQPETANDHIPYNVSIHDIYFWETSIDALGVRRMPEDSGLGWVLMQAGNNDQDLHDKDRILGEYWSGNEDYFDQPRQPRIKGRYVNNQGGWMATPRQIFEWHTRECRSKTFLPPYYRPIFNDDGLTHSVEFWSGGIHIFGAFYCNIQRIMPLHPSMFSHHLLYHTSNNKQRSGNVMHRYSSRTINEFWAQLNTVRKNAERRMHKELINKTIISVSP
jgi:hypothetical protein